MKVKPHGLTSPVVVTLTSYAARFPTLHFTLRCLLRQTMRADRIILWVSEEDLSRLPEKVLELREQGLEIRTAKDMKAYTKILPALDALPGAYLCSADDDVFYPPVWLEELIRGVEPKMIVCHRAHEIILTESGHIRPYLEWDFDFREERSGPQIFATGVGGVLYPPGILAHEAGDRSAAFELSPFSDEIWFYWMARRNGAEYKRVGPWRAIITWPGSQKQALSQANIDGGQNDIQIARMVERYGLPFEPTVHSLSR